MAGFGSLGGPGGLGGFGTSYPTRVASPNSNTVDWMGSKDGWEADWQARHDAAMQNRYQDVKLTPNSMGQHTPAAAPYLDEIANSRKNNVFAHFGIDPNAPWAQGLAQNTDWMKGSIYDPASAPRNSATGAMQTVSVNMGPDTMALAALDAERERMLPKFEAQPRLQQAYDVMRGGNAQNGILSEAYAQPGFNRISTAGGMEGNSGVNTGTGLYDPLTGSGAIGQARPRRWGQ